MSCNCKYMWIHTLYQYFMYMSITLFNVHESLAHALVPSTHVHQCSSYCNTTLRLPTVFVLRYICKSFSRGLHSSEAASRPWENDLQLTCNPKPLPFNLLTTYLPLVTGN